MEGALFEKNTQSTTKSFVEQHSLVIFEISADFTQIELNIIILDNTHSIKFVALGTNDILKLNNFKVMVPISTNKIFTNSHYDNNH
jgi:hypothetical protein